MNLNKATKINDESKFIKSHEAMISGNASEKVKEPYRDRLEKYHQLKQQGKK